MVYYCVMENREIKFRAICTTSKEWVYGYFCKDYAGIGYITSLDGTETSVVDVNTVGQFTGLTDKNGVEIYESDIVSCSYWEPSKYQIMFIDGSFCLCNGNKEWIADVTHMDDSTGKHFKVIGNINQHNLLS